MESADGDLCAASVQLTGWKYIEWSCYFFLGVQDRESLPILYRKLYLQVVVADLNRENSETEIRLCDAKRRRRKTAYA